MEKNNCFWCERCQKKFFIAPDNLVVYPKSSVMKKPPFYDHEKVKDQKTNLKMVPQKTKYKCLVCGQILKEVQNNVTSSDISS